MEHNTPWRVLVVDDEEGIHGITRMIFRDYQFEGRPVELISALSGAEARQLLQQHDDICLALLDVVMESDDEGLRLVDHIRDGLGNRDMRLILRTGHPGFAPETDVIIRYDINDYLSKAELSASRLLTSVLVALRSYRDIVAARRQPDEAAPGSDSDAPLEPLLTPLLHSNQLRLTRLGQLDLNPMARDLLAQIDCNQQQMQALCLDPDQFNTETLQPLAPESLLQQLQQSWLPLSRQQQRLIDLRLDPDLPPRLLGASEAITALWNTLLCHALIASSSADQQWSLSYQADNDTLQLTLSARGGGVTPHPELESYRQRWNRQLRPACERLCQQLGGSFSMLSDAAEELLISASVSARQLP